MCAVSELGVSGKTSKQISGKTTCMLMIRKVGLRYAGNEVLVVIL